MIDQTSPESQELFNLIVENVKDYAIFATDVEGHVVSWNPGVKRLLGYDEAEIASPSSSSRKTWKGGAHLREMEMAARVGRAEAQRWHVRKDGTRFWANGLVMPLRDGGGLRGFAKVADAAHGHSRVDAFAARRAARRDGLGARLRP